MKKLTTIVLSALLFVSLHAQHKSIHQYYDSVVNSKPDSVIGVIKFSQELNMYAVYAHRPHSVIWDFLNRDSWGLLEVRRGNSDQFLLFNSKEDAGKVLKEYILKYKKLVLERGPTYAGLGKMFK